MGKSGAGDCGSSFEVASRICGYRKVNGALWFKELLGAGFIAKSLPKNMYLYTFLLRLF
jgi:hypothetical protein